MLFCNTSSNSNVIHAEYAYTLKVDEKSDVYSFGVLLLELITDIVQWVRKTMAEAADRTEAVVALVDPRLIKYPLARVKYLFKIAMLCVEDASAVRPTMRKVVNMLANPPPLPISPSL